MICLVITKNLTHTNNAFFFLVLTGTTKNEVCFTLQLNSPRGRGFISASNTSKSCSPSLNSTWRMSLRAPTSSITFKKPNFFGESCSLKINCHTHTHIKKIKQEQHKTAMLDNKNIP